MSALAPTDFLPSHAAHDTQTSCAGQEQIPLTDQTGLDAHISRVGEGADFPANHCSYDAQPGIVGGDQTPADHPIPDAIPRPAAVDLLDPTLCIAADVVDDLEKVKAANANRLRTLTTPADGGGAGLTEAHPDIARLAAIVALLDGAEKDAVKQLQRTMRRHPLGPWVKAQRGIGEKQAARLLAAIGDPYMNSATGLPRTVSQLWAYSGLHVLPAGQKKDDAHHEIAGGDQTGSNPDPSRIDALSLNVGVAAKRRKGQKANWSTNAKTRAYLIAESCLKQIDKQCQTETGEAHHIEACRCSPYRVVYDNRRTHTAVTHPEWPKGHAMADALRVSSKAILRDLWIAARDLHQGEPS